ncbi:hypothetical protein EDEG_04017 [Edhazardia aedis USNM 41457]|uniref:Uncharacterized protein n=1 Tax=Edhazardia aedis (strain USNM 41457) TaxID=1003232 RepID=J9DFG1_EDHAE|nr:hypothetical protein EDEG_04017 [Edhazardia aedis USNM 41457]|eukprot:EJW01340.1 hypothetical protein EDEG_04017 [Edhazardia aedis USNM 41457]
MMKFQMDRCVILLQNFGKICILINNKRKKIDFTLKKHLYCCLVIYCSLIKTLYLPTFSQLYVQKNLFKRKLYNYCSGRTLWSSKVDLIYRLYSVKDKNKL